MIGGNDLAEAEVRELLNAKAGIRLIAPTVTEQLSAWSREEKLCWESRSYRSGDLHDAFLVVSVADTETNATVFEEVEKRLREGSRTQEPNLSEERIENCVDLLRHIYRLNKFSSVKKATRDIFVDLCSILKIKTEDKSTKETMYNAIKEDPAVCLVLRFYVPLADYLVDQS